VSHPPASVHCIFKEIHPGTVPITNIFEIYWQTNGTLVRRFLGEPSFQQSKRETTAYLGDVAAEYNTNAWYISETAFTKWPNINPDAATGNIAAQNIENVLRLCFSRIMNAGLQFVPLGSIQWDGDSFSLTNT